MQLLQTENRVSESEKEKFYSTDDNIFEAAESNISLNRFSVLDSDVLPTITKAVSSNSVLNIALLDQDLQFLQIQIPDQIWCPRITNFFFT
jgi:hypothetical protein